MVHSLRAATASHALAHPCLLGNRRSITEPDLTAVTESEVRARCGLLVVERVVDRVERTMSASCASRAFRWAIGAGSACRAVGRGHGKEKVYGSIP